MNGNILPGPGRCNRAKCKCGTHIEDYTCSSSMHHAVEIGVFLTDEKFECDGSGGGRGENPNVGHEVEVETLEVGGGGY